MSTEVLAAVRRSSHTYCELLSEQVALSCGVAFFCPAFPGLAEANQLREVVVPADRSLAEAFIEVESVYAARSLKCSRWVPAMSQTVEPIEAFLLGRGFLRRDILAMAWRTEAPISARSDVRILPARAMRKALHDVRMTDLRHDEATRKLLAVSDNERLDDPQYDTFVAVEEGRPAGLGTLYQVGDIGRIKNIFVAEPFRRRGVALAMMRHLLALSRRLAMRITVVEAESDDDPAISLFHRCGFEPGGTYAEFIAP